MLFLLSSVIQHSYIYIYTSTKECRERRDLVRRVSVPQALDWFGDWVLINPPPVCMVSHPHHVLVVSCMGRLAGSKITTPHARCSLHHLGAGVAHQLYESHTTTAGGCLASRRTGGAAHAHPGSTGGCACSGTPTSRRAGENASRSSKWRTDF